MLTPERLREIKDRCERATPGPWECRVVSDCVQDRFDADFITHAREDVPVLVAEVEQLHRFAKEIRRTARHWRRRARVMMAKGKASDRPDDAHWFAGQAEAFEQAAWDLEIILVELLGGNENAE